MKSPILENKYSSIRGYLLNTQIYALKCALSVILAYFVAKIAVPEDLLSASFTAVLCVKPTSYSGLKEGKDQLFSSLIGAIITTLFLHFIGHNIFVLGLSLFITMSICINRNLSNYLVAVFTVLYVFIIPQQTELNTVIVRMSSVFWGFSVASLINFLFSLVRYKSFLHFRTSYSLNMVINQFLITVNANKSADLNALDNLYDTFESVYDKLSIFATEAHYIQKELAVRKSLGGIKEKDAFNIFRIIESLKMSVRYLQDISFISKLLVPNHEKIPQEWKRKIDLYWIEIEEKYSTIIERFISKEFNSPINPIIFEVEIIYDITEKIKVSDEAHKVIFTETLAIFIDFQQIVLTLNNLEYYIIEYLKSDVILKD